MIIYKGNIIERLKEKGYTTYKLRTQKLLAEAVIQALREQRHISFDNLDKLCALLECQPGDIISYVPDNVGDTIRKQVQSKKARDLKK